MSEQGISSRCSLIHTGALARCQCELRDPETVLTVWSGSNVLASKDKRKESHATVTLC